MKARVADRRPRPMLVIVGVLALLVGVFVPTGAAYAVSPLTDTPTPVITGEARVGVTLTADPGIWRPAIVTMKYQWYANGSAVSGASRSTFVPTAAMVGKTVTVRATGSKSGYSSVTKASDPTDPVLPLQSLGGTDVPVITGEARVGLTLTADPGAWLPAETRFTYRWLVGPTAVAGATTETFVVPASAVGKVVSVRVTGSLPGYISVTTHSAGTAPVLKPLSLTSTAVPTIVGVARAGYPLLAQPGHWGPAPISFRFQWYANGKKIAGATSQAFTPSGRYTGKRLAVTVIGSQAGYVSASRSSVATAKVVSASKLHPVQVFSVEPVGLGVRVAWSPTAATDLVDRYIVTASPTAGTGSPLCADPDVVTAATTDVSTGLTMGGLCAGVVYTVRVAGAVGTKTGPPGRPSTPIVPLDADVPESPLLVSALARNGSAVVAWTRPPFNGGKPLTGYELTATHDAEVHTLVLAAGDSSAVVDGLSNGTEYDLALVAINSIGSSVPSPGVVTPSAAYVPGTPTEAVAQPDGTGKVDVSWSPPIDDGGADVTGYRVSYREIEQDADGLWVPVAGAVATDVTVSAPDTSVSVDSFVNPLASYRFQISAANSAGEGDAAVLENPVTPTVTIDSDVVVLEDATVSALTSVTPTVLTWSAPFPAQANSLIAGKVIVAGDSDRFPGGALRTVVKVARTSSRLTVTVREAALTEAFTSGSMSAIVDPLSDEESAGPGDEGGGSDPGEAFGGGTFIPSMPGVGLTAPDISADFTVSNTQTFSLGLTGQAAGGIKYEVKGSVNLTSTASLGVNVSQNAIGIPDGVSVSALAKISNTSGITATISGKQTWKVGEIVGAPVTIFVGPVPLVLVPKVPIYLTVEGNVSVGVTATQTAGAKVSWSSKDPGTLKTESLNTPIILGGDRIPGLSATGKASIKLSIEAQIAIYNVAGPTVTAQVSLTADINFLPGPGQSFLTITPKFTLSAGLALDQFGQHLSLTVPILSASPGTPFKIGTVPNGSYTVTTSTPSVAVGQSATFIARRSDGESAPITWSVIGGVSSDRITSSGVFTAASPAGRTVTIKASDAGGAAGQTTITIGAVFDPPRGVTTVPATGAGAIKLSWIAPGNTGGSAVASYRVSVVGGGTPISTTARTATVTGLPAGVSVIEIRAVNTAGVTSAPASVTIDLSNGGYPSSISVSALGPVPVPSPDGWGAFAIRDLVCGSDTTCVSIGNAYATTNSSVIGLHDGLWTAAIAPVPSGGVAGTASSLFDPVCSAPDVCSVVGYYQLTGGGDARLVEMYRGGNWFAIRLPDGIFHATCLRSGECIGVGATPVGGYASRPQIAEYRGGAWHDVPMGMPSDVDPQWGGAISDLACSADGTCVGVGDYIPLNGTSPLFLATRSNGAWSMQKMPQPPNAKIQQSAFQDIHMACGNLACIIGGSYIDTSTRWRAGLLTYSSGRWSAIVAPRGSDGSSKQFLDGTDAPLPETIIDTDCPTQSMCTAVGIYGVTATRWRTVVYDYEYGVTTWAVSSIPARTSPWAFANIHLWCGEGQCVYQQPDGSAVASRDGVWRPMGLPVQMKSCTATLCRSYDGTNFVTWRTG